MTAAEDTSEIADSALPVNDAFAEAGTTQNLLFWPFMRLQRRRDGDFPLRAVVGHCGGRELRFV